MKSDKTGKIIILSGPSGVGKGTICIELFKHEFLNLQYSVSATTRKPRENEIDGTNYHFLSIEKFNRELENNNFIENVMYADNHYGTLKSEVFEKITNGINVLLEVDLLGAISIINNDELKSHTLTIFISPPSIEELETRLKNRNTETSEQIQKRMDAAQNEILHMDKYMYRVVNDDLNKVVQEIIEILLKETNTSEIKRK